MSTRIDQRFAELKRQGRAGLVTFLTAGDPDAGTSLAILRSLPAAGADLIGPWPLKLLVDHALGDQPPPAWLQSITNGSDRTSLLLVAVVLLPGS